MSDVAARVEAFVVHPDGVRLATAHASTMRSFQAGAADVGEGDSHTVAAAGFVDRRQH